MQQQHAELPAGGALRGLDWENVISVHAPNPDRPITRRDILATLGR
jgi:hypothetical protein